MVLGLKFHFHTHPASSIPLDRKPQTTLNPFFQVKPIKTFGFLQLPLTSRRINPEGLKALSLEVSNGNGGGGGGVEDRRKDGGGDGDGDRDGDRYGDEAPRLYVRLVEFLLGPNRHPVVAVALMQKLGWMCAQVAWQLHLFGLEFEQSVQHALLGALLLSFGALGSLVWFCL